MKVYHFYITPYLENNLLAITHGWKKCIRSELQWSWCANCNTNLPIAWLIRRHAIRAMSVHQLSADTYEQRRNVPWYNFYTKQYGALGPRGSPSQARLHRTDCQGVPTPDDLLLWHLAILNLQGRWAPELSTLWKCVSFNQHLAGGLREISQIRWLPSTCSFLYPLSKIIAQLKALLCSARCHVSYARLFCKVALMKLTQFLGTQSY